MTGKGKATAPDALKKGDRWKRGDQAVVVEEDETQEQYEARQAPPVDKTAEKPKKAK